MFTSPLPGIVSHTRAGRRVRVTEFPRVAGPDAVVKSDQLDAGSTRTTLLRPAYCLVKVTATGKYVAADDATGDRNTAAAIVSAEAVDGAWNGATLTFRGHFGTVTFLSASAATAALVTALNADAGFSRFLVASGADGFPLAVATRDVGAEAYVKATSTIDGVLAGFGPTGAGDAGEDADYCVSEGYTDLLDGNAVARDGAASVTRAAHYDAPQLLRATAEALAVLARRGSIFDGSPTVV
jgi:hypothetical protein